MKKIIIIETIVVIFLGIIALTQAIGVSWSQEKILESCQPENIDYKSGDPYCLSINIERQTLGTKTFVKIAKKADPDGIYHGFNYPYSLNEQNMSEIKVIWSENGIELNTETGFSIRIPKESFIGGR